MPKFWLFSDHFSQKRQTFIRSKCVWMSKKIRLCLIFVTFAKRLEPQTIVVVSGCSIICCCFHHFTQNSDFLKKSRPLSDPSGHKSLESRQKRRNQTRVTPVHNSEVFESTDLSFSMQGSHMGWLEPNKCHKFQRSEDRFLSYGAASHLSVSYTHLTLPTICSV